MIFFDSLLSSLFKSQNTSNLIIEIGTHFELQRNPLQQVIVSQRILDKEMDYVMWGYSIPSPSPFLSLPNRLFLSGCRLGRKSLGMMFLANFSRAFCTCVVVVVVVVVQLCCRR